mmetsp:Transcript_120630/g.286573  ORF Transcript_120630/g.286573 Transcript_120630/m.286573 type:complete len:201 (+) Transcript_120630:622-1224(+)
MAPVVHLRHVRIQLRHGLPELVLPCLGAAKVGEEHLPGVRHEAQGAIQLHLQLVGGLPCAGRLHAEGLLGHCPKVLKVLPKELQGPELPRLRQASDPGTAPHQGEVILGGFAPKAPVHALVIGPLNLIGRQRLLWLIPGLAGKVQGRWIVEAHRLRDQDPVGGLVADVSKVVSGDLHWQCCLQQPGGIELVELHGLLVHR